MRKLAYELLDGLMKSSNKSVEEELVHFCDIDISEILEVVTILQILNHVQSSYN